MSKTVVIRKPENVSESPYWSPEMDKYDGMRLKMSAFSKGNRYLSHDGWYFNPKWVHPSIDDDNNPKLGDE